MGACGSAPAREPDRAAKSPKSASLAQQTAEAQPPDRAVLRLQAAARGIHESPAEAQRRYDEGGTLALSRTTSSEVSLAASIGGVEATVDGESGSWRAAASPVVMRSGRHFAQFTVREGRDMMFGAIREHYPLVKGAIPHVEEGHSFYNSHALFTLSFFQEKLQI